MIVIKQISRD